MNEPYLTWAEIEKQYANEWVLVDVLLKRGWPVKEDSGFVVVHCADRAEFMRLVLQWADPGGKCMTVRYAGTFPEEVDEVIPVEPELARQ